MKLALNWLKGKMIAIAVVLLWLKTYIVYKVSFDITIETLKQELILFINPLSTLILFSCIPLFFVGKKREKAIMAMSLFFTMVLYSNVVYYRFFTDFITIPVLFQTSNMGDLGNSIFELIHIGDILIFIDLFVIGMLIKKLPSTPLVTPRKRRIRIAMIALTVFAVNLGLAETERPQLLTRTFDREILVKNIGTYNYHIYDVLLQSKSRAQRAFADSSKLIDIENYVKSNRKPANPDMFGLAKDKNVIVISMESTQNFVINRKVNGEEVTPFLNRLIKDSFYFDEFYHQTSQGKTSDSEFLLENSLYPLPRGAVFFTHPQNEYHGLAEIIGQSGYTTAVFHANNKSFWNRDIMYDTLGYDRFFSLKNYELNEENTVGWGLKDISFFEQSVEHLKTLPQPFYTKFITLTNHFPFELEEEDKLIDEFDTEDRTVSRYFPTVRYTDEAIKHFFELLKKEGLYKDSIIIIYGDHYGISENHNNAMSKVLGKEITPFETVQLQKVPMIIHIPGYTDHETISTVSGQIDLKPTLLHLLGFPTRKEINFGNDLFSQNKHSFALLRDGSFITENYVYTKSTCYSKETGLEVEKSNCQRYLNKAKQELDYSDQIIYGDLLRFYEPSEGFLIESENK